MADRERVLALLHELEGADAEKGVLLEELDRLANDEPSIRDPEQRSKSWLATV